MEEFAAAMLLDGDYAVKSTDFAGLIAPPRAVEPSADTKPALPPKRQYVLVKTIALVALSLLLGLGAIAGLAEAFPRHTKKRPKPASAQFPLASFFWQSGHTP